MAINCHVGFDARALTVGNSFLMYVRRVGETTAVISAGDLKDQTADSVYLFMHEKTIEGIVNNDSRQPYDGIWADDSFRSTLTVAVNSAIAIAGWAGTPEITWAWTSGIYSFGIDDAADFGIVWGNAASARVLGFTTGMTGAAAFTAAYLPAFYIASELPEVSDASDLYEPGGQAAVAFSDSGYPQESISRTYGVRHFDFSLQFEPKYKVFAHAATGLAWTYEALFGHCRSTYPVLFDNTHWEDAPNPAINGDPVVLLRGDGASFDPQRTHPNYDGLWHIPFNCYLVGWK